MDVPASDLVTPLAMAVATSIALLAALGFLWRSARRAAIVVSAASVLALSFGHLTAVVLPADADVVYLLLGCAAVLSLVALVAVRAVARLSFLTQALNVTSLVAVGMALIPIVTVTGSSDSTGPIDEEPVAAFTAPPGVQMERDIFHIVLDRYGSSRALELRYGLDNSECADQLERLGFRVVDDTRANYVTSVQSLAATLRMDYLDDVVELQGPDVEDYVPLADLIRASRVGAQLQSQGYRYLHIGNWYEHTRDSWIADQIHDPDVNVSFESTLYDYSILPAILGLLTGGSATESSGAENSMDRKHAATANGQFEALLGATETSGPDPVYVYTHVLVPHAPYVFMSDGTYDPENATYESQLQYANQRVLEIARLLLDRPDAEQPIVIIQADEGPLPERYDEDFYGFDWASATDSELLTKYTVLNTMYLPGDGGSDPLPQTMSLVNTYREVFRRYLGVELPDLEHRSFASSVKRPFDLRDITDRVDSAISRLGTEPAGRAHPFESSN